MISFFFFTKTVIIQLDNQQFEKLKQSVTEQSIIIQSELVNEINSSLNLVLGLIGFVNVDPTPSDEDFQKIARVIINRSGIIRNIALAPDNVIEYIYPIEGNEKAIGLNYLKNEEQSVAVYRAINTGKEVIAGPVNLVQGGVGLIAQIPIYIDDDMEQYWGIASIVVDIDKLFSKIDIDKNENWLNIAIKGKDGKGLSGDMIFGDPKLFEDNPVLTQIILPEGSWVMAAKPVAGWNTSYTIWHKLIWLIGMSLGAVIAALVLKILSTNKKLRFLALHDPLTKLANRRKFRILAEQYLEQAERDNKEIYLIFFDLDNFKKINDFHGHKIGDSVLIHIVDSIVEQIRKTDIFARVGGDEFILIPNNINTTEDLEILCNKIIKLVKTCGNKLNLDGRLGCSIGISCFPKDGRTLDELIKNADYAMYMSKKNGKNQFCYYSKLNQETPFKKEIS